MCDIERYLQRTIEDRSWTRLRWVTKCAPQDYRQTICGASSRFQWGSPRTSEAFEEGRLRGRGWRMWEGKPWVCAPCVHCGLPCANFSKFIRHAVNAKSGPNSTIPCNLSENVYVIFPGTAEDPALDPPVVQGQYREPTTLPPLSSVSASQIFTSEIKHVS